MENRIASNLFYFVQYSLSLMALFELVSILFSQPEQMEETSILFFSRMTNLTGTIAFDPFFSMITTAYVSHIYSFLSDGL